MEDRHEQQDRPQPRTVYCYRHPDRETGISCTRCERPICPECMIAASVGFQCPECVRGGSGTGHSAGANRPRTLAGGVVTADPKRVTKVLLGINAAVFLAVLLFGDRLVTELYLLGQFPTGTIFIPFEGIAEGEWYRLLTAVFLHEQVLHIVFNMLLLWFLGPPVEAALGRSRFLALYLLSGLGGSALTYLIADADQPSLGASGAIYGLLGATVVLVRRLNHDVRPIAVLLAINLVLTFTGSNIAWEAHIGGLVTGGIIGWAMVHAPREKRAVVQYGTAAAMLLVIIAVCVFRTVQLTG